MAKMTVREFAKSVGLTTSGADYIASTVMLKVLVNKGVAKEVDRINTSASGRGRKSVVYEIPDEVRFSLDTVAAFAKPEPVAVVETAEATEVETAEVETAEVAEVEQAVVATIPVEEAVVEQKFCYDDDEDEAEAA